MCSECEVNRKSGAKFCLECGGQINEKFLAVIDTFCQNCPQENKKATYQESTLRKECFCPYCGSKTTVLRSHSLFAACGILNHPLS